MQSGRYFYRVCSSHRRLVRVHNDGLSGHVALHDHLVKDWVRLLNVVGRVDALVPLDRNTVDGGH